MARYLCVSDNCQAKSLDGSDSPLGGIIVELQLCDSVFRHELFYASNLCHLGDFHQIYTLIFHDFPMIFNRFIGVGPKEGSSNIIMGKTTPAK